MAISDSAKVDLLYKKYFGVTKTDLPANKSPSNESISSPALLRGDIVWQQATSIPPTAAAAAGVVQAYQTTSRIECVADTTTTPISSVYPSWKTNLTDWIPPEFGSTYFVKVYAETTGNANPTTGTPLSDSGIAGVGEWNFDYSAGVLNFIGGTIPAALTASKVIYITGYRYIGTKGVTNYPGGMTIGNITITGNTITGNAAGISFGSNMFGSNITVSNATISVTSTGTLVVNSTANIIGNVALGANLTVANNAVISGNLTVTGNISGNITGGTVVGISSGVNIPASQNQLYVAKNGSDSNNGTINAPFLTIKAALAAAGAITSATGVSVNVAPGSYTEDNPITIPAKVALMGDNLRNVSVIPQTPNADLFYMTNGCYVWGITIRDYTANGFSYSSSTSSQNVFVSPYIQNLTSATTTGTAVMIDGNYTSSISTKAMIVGFFTIINRGGYGIHLSNSAYSQLVNIYTIANEVGIWCESGGFCTLNGSDCSIGNVGLRADSHGPLLTYGNTYGYSTGGKFQIRDYPDAPHVNQVVSINGDSNYYSIDTIRQVDGLTWEINIQETYNSNLAPLSNIRFYQRSAIIASAHTFEYVGAGTDPATALPQYGGIPDANLRVITTDGGKVTYTATDEKGNFTIGGNLVINQGTGTISGTSFDISLFAKLTPYILALEG
jgi:hypothetical protein